MNFASHGGHEIQIVESPLVLFAQFSQGILAARLSA